MLFHVSTFCNIRHYVHSTFCISTFCNSTFSYYKFFFSMFCNSTFCSTIDIMYKGRCDQIKDLRRDVVIKERFEQSGTFYHGIINSDGFYKILPNLSIMANAFVGEHVFFKANLRHEYKLPPTVIHFSFSK